MLHVVDGICKRKKGTAEHKKFRNDSCKKEIMQIAKESRINIIVMHRNRLEFSESPDCLTAVTKSVLVTPCGYWKSSLDRWEAERLGSALRRWTASIPSNQKGRLHPGAIVLVPYPDRICIDNIIFNPFYLNSYEMTFLRRRYVKIDIFRYSWKN